MVEEPVGGSQRHQVREPVGQRKRGDRREVPDLLIGQASSPAWCR